MGFDISSVFGGSPVPNSGTEVKRIPIAQIDEDERNFYTIADIDALADNIAIVGLLDPIRVVPSGADRYTVVSGHRRRAACELLGRTEIDCIVESPASSPELEELRLIFANSATRRMSDADLSKQSQRVEALIPALKEQGFEFPGRTVDWVAKLCETNKTKLGNLHYIEEHLIPEWHDRWREGALATDAALAMAHIDEAGQRLLIEAQGERTYGICANEINCYKQTFDQIGGAACDRFGGKCSNVGGRIAHAAAQSGYSCPSCLHCCAVCYSRFDCPQVCHLLRGHIAAESADRAAKKAEEDARTKAAQDERRAAELAKRQRWAKLWVRFGKARKAAGVSVDAFLSDGNGNVSADGLTLLESDPMGTNWSTNLLPFHYWMELVDVDSLTGWADRLGCSLDYLLCRTDEPNPPAAELSDAGPRWNDGKPPKAGLYYARFEVEGHTIHNVSVYDSMLDAWRFKHGAKIEADCTGWWPLPEEG